MAQLVPEGKQSYATATGAPLVGGRVYTYDTGTNTPRLTYSDAAGLVPNANPVVLDARGEATIFWSGAYKVILKDSLDVTIWTVDPVSSFENIVSVVPVGSAALPSYTFTGRLNTGMWSSAVDVLSWSTGGASRMALNNTSLVLASGITFNVASAVANFTSSTPTVHTPALILEGGAVNSGERSNALIFSGSNHNAAIWSLREVGFGGSLILATQSTAGGNPVERIRSNFAGKTTFSGGFFATPQQPTHSATPTFDTSTSNVFEPALMTSNVTSITLTSVNAGQTVMLRMQQDTTGGRTCAVPAGAVVLGTITLTANKVSWLSITYSARSGVWEGQWINLP